MRRLRVATGLTLIAIASFLSVDATTRLKTASSALAVSWPYLLATFAAFALLATLVEMRRLAGVAALGAVAVAGIVARQSGLDITMFWPLLLIAAGALVALGGEPPGTPHRLVSVAWPVRRTPRDQLPSQVTVTCVLGTVHLDLRDTTFPPDAALYITTFVGHVWLKVPAQWPVLIDGVPSLLVTLDERGRRDLVGPEQKAIRLRSRGALGTVVVERY
ncbi:hypothetical protein SAMN04488564_1297 [Lentzea waywayandensis]|uniref:Cell wall-active antibiotics response LiaF-like C-terminal domain-containing protein n=1 Tax=Lentzea waywayandensis TaxID=84724 RepID=A0A1I6FJL0_9PSEU|nr:hypothetical protein [Lentzea waywayandensis]SFR30132.1 hypothetical protein SAMN04488564_1297 [Lentzea waywayandensis]